MFPRGCSNQTTGALPLSHLFGKGSHGICWQPLPPTPSSDCNTPSVSLAARWEGHKNRGTGVNISIQQKTISRRLSYHWLRLVKLLHCLDMDRCSPMKAILKLGELLIHKITLNLKSFLLCAFFCLALLHLVRYYSKVLSSDTAGIGKEKLKHVFICSVLLPRPRSFSLAKSILWFHISKKDPLCSISSLCGRWSRLIQM